MCSSPFTAPRLFDSTDAMVGGTGGARVQWMVDLNLRPSPVPETVPETVPSVVGRPVSSCVAGVKP